MINISTIIVIAALYYYYYYYYYCIIIIITIIIIVIIIILIIKLIFKSHNLQYCVIYCIKNTGVLLFTNENKAVITNNDPLMRVTIIVDKYWKSDPVIRAKFGDY